MLSTLASFLGGPSSTPPQPKSILKKTSSSEKRVRFSLTEEQLRYRPSRKRSSSPHPRFRSREPPPRPSTPSRTIPTSIRPASPQRSHAPSSGAPTTPGRPGFASRPSTPIRPSHRQSSPAQSSGDSTTARGRPDFTPRLSTPATISLASRLSSRPSNAHLSFSSTHRETTAPERRPQQPPPSRERIYGSPGATHQPVTRPHQSITATQPRSNRQSGPRHFQPSPIPQLQPADTPTLTSLLSSIFHAPPPPPAPQSVPRPLHLIPAGNTLLDPVAQHPERWRLWWTTPLPLQQSMEKFDEESRRMDLRMRTGGVGNRRERLVRRVVVKRGEEWVETWVEK